MSRSRIRLISTKNILAPPFLLLLVGFVLVGPVHGFQKKFENDESESLRSKILSLSETHFPEIKREKIRLKKFTSSKNFFKARFSVGRFVTPLGMRHLISYNPLIFQKGLKEEALEAILIHELSHVSYYTRKNRLQLIGLVCLVKSGKEIQFERKADLETIELGFASGLKEYRNWLYRQISSEDEQQKRKFYLSPEEIELAEKVKKEKPGVFARWQRKAPRNIEEMREESGIE